MRKPENVDATTMRLERVVLVLTWISSSDAAAQQIISDRRSLPVYLKTAFAGLDRSGFVRTT